ncbi:MAG TPA: HEAT repeat domain-containing protein [Ktedonobacteraceae bacterium]|nr:HEAT repeat domain-containing protein [Ktedonobacteraceae bacterium]
MRDELDPTPELQALVEQLGVRDWNTARAAQNALASTGEAGMAAVIWGLSHPNVRVRGGCAAFLDHHGTDACFAPLRQVALHDPAPSVRRMAVHSASCQECKQCPLTGDLVGLLIEVALSDTNRRIRLHALWSLHRPQDARTVAALKSILHDADPELVLDAYYALISQDPNYRGDPVGLHVQVALSSAHKYARLKALGGLQRLPPDARAITAMEQILHTETDPRLRNHAHHALKQQDPSYKVRVDAEARKRGIEQGIAVTRARKERRMSNP